jgi:hypothetical protein
VAALGSAPAVRADNPALFKTTSSSVVGVAELPDGSVMGHVVNTVEHYSASGDVLASWDDGVPAPQIDHGHMAYDPGSGLVFDLTEYGVLRVFDPVANTVSVLGDVSDVPPDANHVYDAFRGDYYAMGGWMLVGRLDGEPPSPWTSTFGDIAVRRSDDDHTLHVYFTGRTPAKVHFLERLEWVDNQFTGARVLLSSTGISAYDDFAYGVAALPDGSIATDMTECNTGEPSTLCTDIYSWLIVFPPELETQTSGTLDVKQTSP